MNEEKSFKDSMERLNIIVSQLEQNDVELEAAISLYEEGLQLVKACDGKLNQFEGQIVALMKTYGENNDDETV